MRILAACTIGLLAACAASPSAPQVTEHDVLSLARARTAEECKRQKYGCDVEISRSAKGWFVTVVPVLSIAPDGQHMYAVHSGWNFVYSPSGKFEGDRGW